MPHPLFDDKTGKQFAAAAERGDVRAMGRFLRDVSTRLDTLSETELAFTDGVTAGTGLASKALVLDSSGNVIMPDNGVFGMSRVSVAAIGADAAGAAVLADQVNVVTASNGAKGVALPAAAITEGPIWVINSVAASALLVYPVSGGDDTINGSASVTLGPAQMAMFIPTSATEWYCPGMAIALPTVAEINVLDGATAGTGVASKAMVRDASNEMDGVPVAESQSVDLSQKVTLFDDFLEGTLDASRWSDSDGTDAEAIGPTIVAASTNGEILITSGDVGDGSTPGNTTAVVDGAAIDGKDLMWLPTKGGLVMETRLKITTVAESILFVGFQGEVSIDADVNLAMQASGTGDVIKSEVTEGAGIIYDTSFQTNPTKFAIGGVKATTPTTTVVGATGPSDGTYVTLRVTISAAGLLEGFVDGVSIGTVASAITETVKLTPAITVASNDVNESLVTVDYIWVQQNR